MTEEKRARIGLVRSNPAYWVCCCAEGRHVKPISLKTCPDCAAKQKMRYPATWEDAERFLLAD